MKPLRFYIEIVRRGSEKVVKRWGPHSDWKAKKIESGANINLNDDEYYTRIVEE